MKTTTKVFTMCPFCSEKIQADAVKCKHCGEWLVSPALPFDSTKGSLDARAVSKGIKEAEYSKHLAMFLTFIDLLISISLGLFIHWLVGLVLFFAIGFWISSKYHKE